MTEPAGPTPEALLSFIEKLIRGARDDVPVNCRNGRIGCYHDSAIHDGGSGRCLVRGCHCTAFIP